MAGVSKEIQPSPKPGNIVLSNELRGSLNGIDMSRSLFDSFELMDYFKSVNKFYLENKGKIIGPVDRMISGIDEKCEEELDGFILDGSSWGGIEVDLEWDEKKDVGIKKRISLELFYSDRYDYFHIGLTGGSKRSMENDEFSLEKSFSRSFWINPPSFIRKEADDIFLNFTNELFKAKIL